MATQLSKVSIESGALNSELAYLKYELSQAGTMARGVPGRYTMYGPLPDSDKKIFQRYLNTGTKKVWERIADMQLYPDLTVWQLWVKHDPDNAITRFEVDWHITPSPKELVKWMLSEAKERTTKYQQQIAAVSSKLENLNYQLI